MLYIVPVAIVTTEPAFVAPHMELKSQTQTYSNILINWRVMWWLNDAMISERLCPPGGGSCCHSSAATTTDSYPGAGRYKCALWMHSDLLEMSLEGLVVVEKVTRAMVSKQSVSKCSEYSVGMPSVRVTSHCNLSRLPQATCAWNWCVLYSAFCTARTFQVIDFLQIWHKDKSPY